MNAQELLREMFDHGRGRWPCIRVSEEHYCQHCYAISAGRSLTELLPYAADIYLCCACVRLDPSAQKAFEHEAQDVVRGAIIRVHRDREFVRETVQEFWKKVLTGPDAKVNEYGAKGPLLAWLRVAAARLAIDRLRAKQVVQHRETDLGDVMAEEAFGPESTLTRMRFHEPFREAVRNVIAGLSTKERNLLRMHVQGRCSIDQIGRAYGVHRATAARWLEQVKAHISSSVRARLQLTGLNLTDSEFQSVARLVGGELDLGLSVIATGNP